MTVKLFNDVEGKISFPTSTTSEYTHVLQKLSFWNSKVPFLFVVKNCSEIDWIFGFAFGREREQDFVMEIAEGLVGGEDDLFFD